MSGLFGSAATVGAGGFVYQKNNDAVKIIISSLKQVLSGYNGSEKGSKAISDLFVSVAKLQRGSGKNTRKVLKVLAGMVMDKVNKTPDTGHRTALIETLQTLNEGKFGDLIMRGRLKNNVLDTDMKNRLAVLSQGILDGEGGGGAAAPAPAPVLSPPTVAVAPVAVAPVAVRAQSSYDLLDRLEVLRTAASEEIAELREGFGSGQHLSLAAELIDVAKEVLGREMKVVDRYFLDTQTCTAELLDTMNSKYSRDHTMHYSSELLARALDLDISLYRGVGVENGAGALSPMAAVAAAGKTAGVIFMIECFVDNGAIPVTSINAVSDMVTQYNRLFAEAGNPPEALAGGGADTPPPYSDSEEEAPEASAAEPHRRRAQPPIPSHNGAAAAAAAGDSEEEGLPPAVPPRKRAGAASTASGMSGAAGGGGAAAPSAAARKRRVKPAELTLQQRLLRIAEQAAIVADAAKKAAETKGDGSAHDVKEGLNVLKTEYGHQIDRRGAGK